MKFPDHVRQLLVRRFQNKYRDWLIEEADNSSWPLEINLNPPSEATTRLQPEAVRYWNNTWLSWKGAGELIFCHRKWRLLGEQRLASKIILRSANEIAAWIGETACWERAKERFRYLLSQWPSLLVSLPRYYSVLADYTDRDFIRLVDVLKWIHQHPHSGLYLRQLPISGLDSKWIETRKSVINDLLAMINNDQREGLDIYQRCGLKPLPQLIRIRIVDSLIQKQVGGLSDISAPIEEIAALKINPTVVLIIENLQTGLAFSELSNTVIVMGLGYHVSILQAVPWLKTATCFYWGDIDTHGFAILHQIRHHLPDIRSILMDEKILLSHRELWVEEKQQHSAVSLPLLTVEEQTLYQKLKQQHWGQQIRLEQERINWETVLSSLP